MWLSLGVASALEGNRHLAIRAFFRAQELGHPRAARLVQLMSMTLKDFDGKPILPPLPSPPPPITEATRKRIQALCKELKIDRETGVALLQEQFGSAARKIKGTKDLTEEEAVKFEAKLEESAA